MNDAADIDIANKQFVASGARAGEITVMMPKVDMTIEEAIVHAAWLAVLADPMGDTFMAVLDRIRNT